MELDIELFDFASRPSSSDAFLNESGYFRIGSEVIRILGLKDGDAIHVNKFGSEMILALRSPGQPHGLIMRANKKAKRATSSLFCHSKYITSSIGLPPGNYIISDHELVEDTKNNMLWLKLKRVVEN